MSMADVSTIISARRCIVNRYFLTYLPYFCIIYLSILLSILSKQTYLPSCEMDITGLF